MRCDNKTSWAGGEFGESDKHLPFNDSREKKKERILTIFFSLDATRRFISISHENGEFSTAAVRRFAAVERIANEVTMDAPNFEIYCAQLDARILVQLVNISQSLSYLQKQMAQMHVCRHGSRARDSGK